MMKFQLMPMKEFMTYPKRRTILIGENTKSKVCLFCNRLEKHPLKDSYFVHLDGLDLYVGVIDVAEDDIVCVGIDDDVACGLYLKGFDE